MGKLKVGLVAVGAILLAIGIAVPQVQAAVIGVVFLAVGIIVK